MSEEIIRLSDQSERYPPLLREIHEAPTELYVRGNASLLSHEPMLAVVGSRKANHHGKHAVEHLFGPLVATGVPLVSGMAYGIDSLAHAACLEASTPTIAVLGGGIDDASIYPKRHIALAHDIIAAGGAVVSEYEPGTPPHLGQFPVRNRIIIGLCQAVVVVQAAERSGSLISSRLALENGREVAAVPGSLADPLAWGTNRLIRDGATPLLEPSDVFDLLKMVNPIAEATDQQRVAHLTTEQRAVFDALSDHPLHTDELIAATKLASPVLAATIVELEMQDLIHHIGGMKYIKKL